MIGSLKPYIPHTLVPGRVAKLGHFLAAMIAVQEMGAVETKTNTNGVKLTVESQSAGNNLGGKAESCPQQRGRGRVERGWGWGWGAGGGQVG